MALFHKDIGFPANLNLPKGVIDLRYSPHAQSAAKDDRYTKLGPINLPAAIDVNEATVIEVEMEGAKVTKILYRAKLDALRDICIPVIPRFGHLFAKTVWVNLSSDKHRTLDRTKYSNPGRP